MTDARIAVVHDWLDTWGGGENVLAEILRLYPDADLFALVDFMPAELRTRLAGKQARTSFLQRLPGARKHFRGYLPLFPRAIESFDLSSYDLILSSSHAVAKGVRTREGQVHVSYCHTPMRYAWDLRGQYLGVRGLDRGIRGIVVHHLLDRLQDWDRASSGRVSKFIANSNFVRDRIARCYGRDATVIAPPVDTEFFTPAAEAVRPLAREYYVTASRWVPYKRVDLIVEAFRALPGKRLIVAGEGPDAPRVRAASTANVEWTGAVTRERMRELLRGGRAFVFAAEEDFGIVPVEAQACGTPVIAYGRGGALETVRGGGEAHATGLFFATQSADAIVDAIERFETLDPAIEAADCRHNALQFGTARFADAYTQLVEHCVHAQKRRGG